MYPDLNTLGKQDENEPKGYKAFAHSSGKTPLAFFCLWSKDNKRLFYPYPILSFFALSTEENKLLLVIAGNYIIVAGAHLERITKLLQKRSIDYLRESPFAKELLKENQPFITSITTLEGENKQHFDLSAFLSDSTPDEVSE